MQIKLTGLMLSLGLVAGAAQAGDLSFELGDESARVQYSSDLAVSDNAQGEWDVGLLWIDGDGGSDGQLLTGTLRSVGDAGLAPHQVTAALGVRGFWLNADGFDGQGIGLGGEVKARFEGMDRLVFRGHAYYSPEVFTFGDAERFFEWGIGAGYQVIRNGELLAGFRRVTVDAKGGDFTADSGFFVGMRFAF